MLKHRWIPYSPPLFKEQDLQNSVLTSQTSFLNYDAWNDAQQVKEGKFCFLNHKVDLGIPICWSVTNQSLLWQFHLHYFHFLHLLTPTEQADLCLQWIDSNPVGSIGWHPYPLSLRIVNWCQTNLQEEQILKSLFVQTDFLFHHLETYHPGNHLLENARALVFAGKFFQNSSYAKHWLQKGLEILKQETPDQVLADGGYFERSPMYHALMLEVYLDIINILEEDEQNIANYLCQVACRMASFLQATTHPNGKLALFNDSTHEIAPPTSQLLKYASVLIGTFPSKNVFSDTGFWTYQTDDFYFIIKAGLIAPNHLPAHAHADLFSYELSIAGEPIVVNAGVFEYQAGQMRDYVRSTRANNTFCVNQTNQAECWASFRVARRYPPKNVIWKFDSDGFDFSGEFLGYSQLIGGNLKCKRQIHYSIANRHIVVTDSFTGQGQFLVESMIHFDHRLKIHHSDNHNINIEGQNAKLYFATNAGHLSQEKTWRCLQFGCQYESIAFVLSQNQNLPVTLQYYFEF